eukprot:scaffold4323_cov309-Prasinococcus_capsulatus_cf.AAC.1
MDGWMDGRRRAWAWAATSASPRGGRGLAHGCAGCGWARLVSGVRQDRRACRQMRGDATGREALGAAGRRRGWAR